MQPKNENFLDSKTIIAIAISAVFFIGWQTYLTKKYPNRINAQENIKTVSSETTLDPKNKVDSKDVEAVVPESSQTLKETSSSEALLLPEKVLSFKNEDISFDVSSVGMGIKNIKLLKYMDNENQPIQLASSESETLFKVKFLANNGTVNFDLSEPEKGRFVGTANLKGMKIERELRYDEAQRSITNKIKFFNPLEEIKEGISFIIPEKILKDEKKSWFFPSYHIQDFYVLTSEKSESTHFNNLKEDKNISYSVGHLVSVSSQYFTTAFLNKSEIYPEFQIKTKIEKSQAFAQAIYKPLNLSKELDLEQLFYVGPKSIDILKNVDPEMAKVIDFGYFGFLAVPVLYWMKFFQTIVGNWGLAIILLTLTVRLVVLPFNIMSIKSSKAMKKAQPLLNAIREKYKDDPVTLNKQMMVVMKENGANPVGGCLPALLQIPIFLALYRVIGSSVELYHSPFFGWIGDLSSHDHFYVLPALMGFTMFVQQKITPTPMDPVQGKVLAFLPLIMSLFMLQLPSGLTLYMFVSALFGIIQQYILMREKNEAA